MQSSVEALSCNINAPMHGYVCYKTHSILSLTSLLMHYAVKTLLVSQ